MGRNPAVWNEPEVFRPERFLEGGEHERVDPFATFPFHAGPRNCIGQNMAQAVLKVSRTKTQLIAMMMIKKKKKKPDNDDEED